MSTYLGSAPVNVLNLLFRNEKARALYLGSTQVWSDWSPLDLFKDGKQGVWYDPSDKSTLFQDVAGTVPVTKDGDPVALMKDKSGNNNHATQTVSTARPVYKTDGILHWLETDGTDDAFGASIPTFSKSMTVSLALNRANTNVFIALYSAPSGAAYLGATMVGTTSATSRAGTPEYYINNNSIGVDVSRQTLTDNSPVATPYVLTAKAVDLSLWSIINFGLYSGGLAYKGKIYGLVIAEQTASSSTEVSNYLAKKSGVTL